MTKRASGLALILVAGILTLLAAGSVAMLRMAAGLQIQTGASTDAVITRLLARSGIAYAEARLANAAAPPVLASEANQADDWTYREGLTLPIEKALNPSYAQTEPYGDFDLDGRYEEGIDSYRDLDGNGRFDGWTGRLRNRRGGLAGSVFLLKIGTSGGGIDINNGIWTVKPWEANVLDAKPPFLSNRRLADVVNELGKIVGTAPAAGDRLVANRPLGGYRDPGELTRAMGAADVLKLLPHVSVGGRPNRRDWLQQYAGDSTGFADRNAYLGPDPCVPVELEAATPETLQSLFQGIRTYTGPGQGGQLWHGGESGFTLPNDFPTLGVGLLQSQIQPQEAGRLSAFLVRNRPFATWQEFFRKLVLERDLIFDTPDWTANPLGPALSPLSVNEPRVWEMSIAYLTAHPETIHVWPLLPATCLTHEIPQGPYPSASAAGIVEFRPRWALGSLFRNAANRELRSCPLSFTGGGWSVQSLGRIRESRRGPGMALREARYERPSLSAHVQSEFENLGGDAQAAPDVRCAGRPNRERTRTYPVFPLDSCKGLGGVATAAGYRFPAWGGDIRAMYASEGPRGAVFYVPNWEAGQPLRQDKSGVDWRENFQDSVSGKKPDFSVPGINASFGNPACLPASPSDWLLWGDPQQTLRYLRCRLSSWGTLKFPFIWRIGDKFPAVTADGTVPSVSISFWTVFGMVYQDNPMCASITATAGSIIWSQQGLHAIACPVPVPPMEWFHLAVSCDTLLGARLYLDGIMVGAGTYDAAPADTFKPQKLRLENHPSGAYSGQWGGPAELRVHDRPLSQQEVMPGSMGRYWTPDSGAAEPELRGIPSFSSPLYVFDAPATLTDAWWEGYIPVKMQGGALTGETALRVELLCFSSPDGEGTERSVDLSADGSRISVLIGNVRSLRYRVWMNASTDPKDTPVFDGIDIRYSSRRMTLLMMAEQ